MSSSNVKMPTSGVEPLLTAMVLAAGVGPNLTEGPKGESSLSSQIEALFKNSPKPLACEEVDFLYRYRHGVGLSQALHLVGFDGTLSDFVAAQKKTSLRVNSEGFIVRLRSAASDCTDAEVLSTADTNSTADAGESPRDCDSNPDVEAWHCVGSRMAATLGQLSLDDDKDEDVAPDIEAWHSIGEKVSKAMATAASDEEEEGEKTEQWQSVGRRLLQRLADDDEEKPTEQWQSVGHRLLQQLADDHDI